MTKPSRWERKLPRFPCLILLNKLYLWFLIFHVSANHPRLAYRQYITIPSAPPVGCRPDTRHHKSILSTIIFHYSIVKCNTSARLPSLLRRHRRDIPYPCCLKLVPAVVVRVKSASTPRTIPVLEGDHYRSLHVHTIWVRAHPSTPFSNGHGLPTTQAASAEHRI
jgi:hypothetical protein